MYKKTALKKYSFIISFLIFLLSANQFQLNNLQTAYLLFSLALTILLLALFFEKTLLLFYTLWIFITSQAGFLITLIILTALYFFVITPYALALKLCGTCFLPKLNDKKSLWQTAPKKQNYLRQF